MLTTLYKRQFHLPFSPHNIEYVVALYKAKKAKLFNSTVDLQQKITYHQTNQTITLKPILAARLPCSQKILQLASVETQTQVNPVNDMLAQLGLLRD